MQVTQLSQLDHLHKNMINSDKRLGSVAVSFRRSWRVFSSLKSYWISTPSRILNPEEARSPLPGRVELIICGFGALRYQQAACRLAEQAGLLGCFDFIHVYTKLSDVPGIDTSIKFQLESLASSFPRGWGLWAWKPVVVSAVLKQIPDNVEVFYIDAGCEISPFAAQRFNFYRYLLQLNGYLFFSLPFKEREWSNANVLNYFGHSFDIEDFQIQATWFAFLNSPESRMLVNDWEFACLHSDARLLKSTKPDDNPYLLAHREDQSVLSCLLHSKKICIDLPHEDFFLPELYYPNSWILSMPVHAMRLSGSKSVINSLLSSSVDILAEGGLRLQPVMITLFSAKRRFLDLIKCTYVFCLSVIG